jgi:hypothetical protein
MPSTQDLLDQGACWTNYPAHMLSWTMHTNTTDKDWRHSWQRQHDAQVSMCLWRHLKGGTSPSRHEAVVDGRTKRTPLVDV